MLNMAILDVEILGVGSLGVRIDVDVFSTRNFCPFACL